MLLFAARVLMGLIRQGYANGNQDPERRGARVRVHIRSMNPDPSRGDGSVATPD